MPIDDLDHDPGPPDPRELGDPAASPESRDDVDDREYTTTERVRERVAENELPRSEAHPPNEHPEDWRSAAAGKPSPEPEPGEEP